MVSAPARKEFLVRQRSGSKPVQLMVIEPLMAAETDSSKARRPDWRLSQVARAIAFCRLRR